MTRGIWFSACIVAALARTSSGDFVAGPPVGANEQGSFSATYSFLTGPAVGSGTGSVSYQTTDTFVPITLGADGRFAGGLASGSILDLRPEPVSRTTTYDRGGVYARLDVDVRLFWSAGTDAASLFGGFASGVSVASFSVDDGFAPISGPTIGTDFSVSLDAASLGAPGLSGGSYYLGFAGQGYALGPGVHSSSVVGDLVDLSVDPQSTGVFSAAIAVVPEPSAKALLLVAAPGAFVLARRRAGRGPRPNA